MIQRIQSLYLVAVLLLQVWGAFWPFAIYYNGYEFMTPMLYHGQSVLAGIVALVTLFLFKKRTIQLWLCKVIFLVEFLFLVVGVYGIFQEGWSIDRDLIFATDLLALVCVVLAHRAIAKDEALIRSIDRLR